MMSSGGGPRNITRSAAAAEIGRRFQPVVEIFETRENVVPA
jgi:hypothetical protein